jgi:aminocarboxymuconate-semialdehyde decarboxylase
MRGFALSRRRALALGGAAAAASLLPGIAPAQNRAKRFGVIDCHAHWHPDIYVQAMRELNQPIRPVPDNVDLKLRLQHMDRQGVQVHILTILTPAIQWAPPEIGARLARLINDAAIEAHSAYPDRFYAGVAMPIQAPELALRELNRVAGKPGICCVHLPTSNEAKDYLFQPDFEPIFARAQELGYPLVFHPIGKVAGEDRLAGEAFLTNTVGFPFEHTITAARFITSGLLDKYPRLEIVLYHGGGAFPFIAPRIEYGLMKRNITLPHPFQDYVRRFHYDAITYSAPALRYLITMVGSDRVMIGTDNYAFMDIDEPMALVEALKLKATDRSRILTDNAVRLFRL